VLTSIPYHRCIGIAIDQISLDDVREILQERDRRRNERRYRPGSFEQNRPALGIYP
jgi:hypothetical protein